MKTVKITERSSARELLPSSGEEEILVVRGGHAVALVTPFDDDDVEWHAREHSPEFIESIHRAREQVKRGEIVSSEDLDAIFSDKIDGMDLSGFSSPISVETLQRTKCSSVPDVPGVYVVFRPTRQPPKFLDKSVGGWFKGKDPSDPIDLLRAKWIENATVLYVGKGDPLQRRLHQLTDFGLGKSVGHRGGRLIWNLQNHRQLLIRWSESTNEGPAKTRDRLLDQFKLRHGSLPFANLK